jgi:hypothetical protein
MVYAVLCISAAEETSLAEVGNHSLWQTLLAAMARLAEWPLGFAKGLLIGEVPATLDEEKRPLTGVTAMHGETLVIAFEETGILEVRGTRGEEPW